MMPESSHQNNHFIQSVKENDVTGIIDSLSSEVFDVNFRDVTHDLETPLMRLCHSGVSDDDMDGVLQVVGQKIPDVNLQDAVGRTLIMHACIALRHQIVEFSLDRGCDASTCDRMGRSAYHYAAESGSDWIMASLLKQPEALACLKILDYKGYSPTDLARHRKAHSVVKMISQAMSGNNKDSNPRPLNPKPLQPAFMRTAGTKPMSTPKREKIPAMVDRNLELDNHSINSNIGHRNNDAHSRVSSSGPHVKLLHNGNKFVPSDRWEEMPDSEEITENNNHHSNFNTGIINHNNNINNNENQVFGRRINGNKSDILINHNVVDIDGNDDSQHMGHTGQLSPQRNTAYKQNPDKLAEFTSGSVTPMGLIKPRPLPRLSSNQINDNVPHLDAMQTNILNKELTLTQRTESTNALDRVSTNNLSKKLSPKQNVFTLRPAQSNLPSNRARLLAQEQNRSDSILPSPNEDFESPSQNSNADGDYDDNCVPPMIPQRRKASLDLSLPTDAKTNRKTKTPSPNRLGPVVSPRKWTQASDDGNINRNHSYSSRINTKYSQRATLNNYSNNSNNNNNKLLVGEIDHSHSHILSRGNTKTNASLDIKEMTVNNLQANHQEKKQNTPTTIDNEVIFTKKGRQNPEQASTVGRGALRAILNPVSSHRPLLHKRKLANSLKAQCKTLKDSYVFEDKYADNKDNDRDNDNVFEEEIVLISDNSASTLGDMEKPEEDKLSPRSGSRMTIRRSSLSLPDLRDKTRCLVTSQDKSYGAPDVRNS